MGTFFGIVGGVYAVGILVWALFAKVMEPDIGFLEAVGHGLIWPIELWQVFGP